MKDFRDLLVWQKSMKLAEQVYKFTATLPTTEKFGLISQIRRSAVSIPSNIAEGSKRGTQKDFKQFLRIAAGSAAELETQLLLCVQIYSTRDDEIMSTLKEVQKMLEVFMKKL